MLYSLLPRVSKVQLTLDASNCVCLILMAVILMAVTLMAVILMAVALMAVALPLTLHVLDTI